MKNDTYYFNMFIRKSSTCQTELFCLSVQIKITNQKAISIVTNVIEGIQYQASQTNISTAVYNKTLCG